MCFGHGWVFVWWLLICFSQSKWRWSDKVESATQAATYEFHFTLSFFFFLLRVFWWNTIWLYFYIKSMGGLGQEVGKDLLPYIYTGVVTWFERSNQDNWSDTRIYVMSSLKTEQWQVRICSTHGGGRRIKKWFQSDIHSHLWANLVLCFLLRYSLSFFTLSLATTMISAWGYIMHNKQLHMVVNVPPSHCLTLSYNGWGKNKELWVMKVVA